MTATSARAQGYNFRAEQGITFRITTQAWEGRTVSVESPVQPGLTICDDNQHHLEATECWGNPSGWAICDDCQGVAVLD